MKETKSNWECVAEFMKETPEIAFNGQFASWYYKDPQQILNRLSYYKFAAKLIGKEKRVLDAQCQEGAGTWVLAKECGFAQGIENDKSTFTPIQFTHPSICFSTTLPEKGQWDAVVYFGSFEALSLGKLRELLSTTGLVIIGTHTPFILELEEKMRDCFEYVFSFAASDEIVHMGDISLAPYALVVGAKPVSSISR